MPEPLVVRVPPGDTALLHRALARFGTGAAPTGDERAPSFTQVPGALAFVATAPADSSQEPAGGMGPADPPEMPAGGMGSAEEAGPAQQGGRTPADGPGSGSGRGHPEILGWCWGHLLPRPDGTTMAYLHHLEVAGPHHRRGLGHRLTAEFLTAAAEAGATRMFLVTGQENLTARHLYESLGATPATQGPTVSYWWRLGRP